MKKFFALLFTFFLFISLCAEENVKDYSSSNLSVPISDSVYQLLEYADVKGYIPLLPMRKPYSHNFVVKQLKEVLSSDRLTDKEKKMFSQALLRLCPEEKGEWYKTGSYTNRYDDCGDLPVTAGAAWKSEAAFNFNDASFSNEHWGGAYFLGNIGVNVSYKFDAWGGIMKQDESAFAPYTFDKSWDGYQFIFSDFYEYVAVSEEWSGGLKLEPELVASFYDDRVSVDFSRTRRNWGYGSSSLFLSSDAQPFLALETHLFPVKWFETNYIVGTLEYESNGNLKTSASDSQTMYSMISGQFNIGDYAYFGAVSSGVWCKRLELGYMYPLLLPFLYQNQIGDFDNVQIGLYAGTQIPNVTHLYFELFIDECNITEENFFNKDRNMYAFQAGAKTPVPVWLSVLTAQYTKIEPYMYTHPDTENPWYSTTSSYSGYINTSYLNHGECIGYYLPPNSDEFLISFESAPLSFLNTTASYALVRHGCTRGSKAVDGSSYTDTLNYSNLNSNSEGEIYWKNFLHDGAYEWINYLTLGASIDLRKWSLPVSVNLSYTFSYTLHSYGTSDSIEFFSDDEYSNSVGNYVNLSFRIY